MLSTKVTFWPNLTITSFNQFLWFQVDGSDGNALMVILKFELSFDKKQNNQGLFIFRIFQHVYTKNLDEVQIVLNMLFRPLKLTSGKL